MPRHGRLTPATSGWGRAIRPGWLWVKGLLAIFPAHENSATAMPIDAEAQLLYRDKFPFGSEASDLRM